jgi:hypothetical protein
MQKLLCDAETTELRTPTRDNPHVQLLGSLQRYLCASHWFLCLPTSGLLLGGVNIGQNEITE